MNQLKPLYIIGAGGFGRETAWLVERINAIKMTWELRGFIDDDASLWGTQKDGYMVWGGLSVLEQSQENVWCVFAVGNVQARQKGVRRLEAFEQVHFATLTDPGVEMGRTVEIGEGSIICAGTILTVDVRIGKHCIVNLDCTVGHDAVLEDFVTLYPSVNVSGCVKIRSLTEIGTGRR